MYTMKEKEGKTFNSLLDDYNIIYMENFSICNSSNQCNIFTKNNSHKLEYMG